MVTALITAAEYGRMAMVKLLIDHKPSGYTSDVQSKALLAAASRGRMQVVQMMLDDGICDDGKALRVAAERGQMAIVQLLINHTPSKYTPHIHSEAFLEAASHWRYQVVQMMLDEGIRGMLDIGTSSVGRALCKGAGNGHAQLVELLLAKLTSLCNGSQAQAAYAGEQALIIAAGEGDQEVVEVLLKAGIDIDCEQEVNRRVYDPLSWAVRRRQPSMVRFLVEKGASTVDSLEELIEESLTYQARV